MLILSRTPGTTITIGNDVTLTVVEIRVDALGRAQVRLGVDAPKDVAVHREEIYERIRAEGTHRKPSPDC